MIPHAVTGLALQGKSPSKMTNPNPTVGGEFGMDMPRFSDTLTVRSAVGPQVAGNGNSIGVGMLATSGLPLERHHELVVVLRGAGTL